MKFQAEQNARMFFVQCLISLYAANNLPSEVEEYFSFQDRPFNKSKFHNLMDEYSKRISIIEKIINKHQPINTHVKAIVALGIVEFFLGTDKALLIKECLKMSDFFYNNSAKVNLLLESIYEDLLIKYKQLPL